MFLKKYSSLILGPLLIFITIRSNNHDYSQLIEFKTLNGIRLETFYPGGTEPYIELFQILLLILNFAIIIPNIKNLKRIHSKLGINLRLLLLIFLIYEEGSWLTRDICKNCYKFNQNGEFNFHNLNFLNYTEIFNVITIQTLMAIIVTLFISWGSITKLNKVLSFFFFQYGYKFWGSIFFIERIIANLILKTNVFNLGGFDLIYQEYVESFFYLVILFDTFQKLIDSKNNKKTKVLDY